MNVYDNGSRPELAVFDLDGTLYPRDKYVDLVLDVIARGLVALNGATPEFAQRQVAVLGEMMERNWDGTSTTAFVLAQGIEAQDWREFRTRHLDIAGGLSRDDQVVRNVAHLRQYTPVVVLTNNTRSLAYDILRKIGFPAEAFDAVIGAEDVGANPKPAPGAFRTVVNMFGVAAKATWSIGDRYDIDVAPLSQIGGAGVTVSGPAEIADAVEALIDLISSRIAITQPDATN